MENHLALPTVLSITSLIICLLVIRLVWVHRQLPGGRNFIRLMAAVSYWVLLVSLEYSTGYLVLHILFAKLAYIGIVAIGPFFLLFSLQYTHNERYLTRKTQTLLWIIPAIGLGFVATDHWHHLIYSKVEVPAGSASTLPVYSHGPLFWVVIGYTYLLLIIGGVFLLQALIQAKGRYRNQYLVVLVGLLVPWIANIFYVTDMAPFQGVDLSPFTITLSSVFIAMGIRYFGFMELIPIARQKTFEDLKDAILVLDNQNNIVDLNPAARILIGNIATGTRSHAGTKLIGSPAGEVFSSLPGLVAYLDSTDETPCEIDWMLNGERVYYEARRSPINGSPQGKIGLTVVLHEITGRKQAENVEVQQRILAEALRDTASALTSTLDLDEVLDRILANVARVLPHDAAAIAFVEKDNQVRFVRVKGIKMGWNDDEPPIIMELDKTRNLKEMSHTQSPMIIPDIQKYDSWVKGLQTEWVRSFIGAPILIKGKLLGFLNLYSRNPNFFNTEQGDRLFLFADQAAIAIENARNYQEARERLMEQSTLNQIIRSVSSRLDLRELLDIVDQQVNNLLSVKSLLIVSYDRATHKWNVIYQRGMEPLVSAKDYSLDQGMIGYVIENNEAVMFNSKKTARAFLERHGRKSIVEIPDSQMLIPLTVSDQVIGAMSALNYGPQGKFQDNDLRLFITIGNQVSIALENARLFSQVEQLAMYDTLTGLHNRHHFFQDAEQELARAVRYKKPLALAMIDIDHFKAVNDAYGHIAGDLVLRHIAQVCRTTMRKIDIIGRYGGEEFTILMPETSPQNAHRAASRLRQRIEEAVTYLPGESIRVTVSIGVATLEEGCRDVTSLISCADQALYQAKQAGRNRVRLYERKAVL